MPNQQQRLMQPTAPIATDSPDEVIQLLGDIKAQNHTLMQQFDTLETNISKRATMAGAMAGAFTGGVGGTVVSVGIELIKAKFGG